MKKIPLSRGKAALISDRDYWLVNGFKWSCSKQGNCFYALTFGGKVSMHRLITAYKAAARQHFGEYSRA